PAPGPVRSLYDSGDYDAPEGGPHHAETRSGVDREETRLGGDPETTRAGTIDAQSRKKWSAAPRVATPLPTEKFPALDVPLDFPDETKQKARGHRLLDLGVA